VAALKDKRDVTLCFSAVDTITITLDAIRSSLLLEIMIPSIYNSILDEIQEWILFLFNGDPCSIYRPASGIFILFAPHFEI